MVITIIIPTYNEKENIGKLINTFLDIFKTIKAHNLFILVVDDNSPDKTAEVVKDIMKTHKNVYLKVRKEKAGLGAAYEDAMEYAFGTMHSDVIVTCDADFSHDPYVFPKFVEFLENGAKQVIGSRYRKGGGIPDDWGLHRKLLSYGGNKYISLLYFGKGVTDFTGGYKGISKEVYNKVNKKWDKHKGYTFAISTNIETLRAGFDIKEVPFKFKDRRYGKSKMNAGYFYEALIYVTKARIEDFFYSRFGKVVIAGGLGSIAQFISFGLIFKPLVENKNIFNLPENINIAGFFEIQPAVLLSVALSIEVGVFTAFYVNNLWAFKDHKLTGLKFWIMYLKNHLVVIGAIIIQLVLFQLLANLFGRGIILDYIYLGIGILVGLLWNFYFYKKIIWKIK